MNYLLATLAIMAAVICLVSFPIPSLIALAVVAGWWLVKGRRRRY